MATLFYDHLIDWQKLTNTLDILGIHGEDRHEVVEHAEHIIHTEVLIVLISHLPTEKHDEFMQLFYTAPYDANQLKFLKTHGKEDRDVESAVRQRSAEVIAEILKELAGD